MMPPKVGDLINLIQDWPLVKKPPPPNRWERLIILDGLMPWEKTPQALFPVPNMTEDNCLLVLNSIATTTIPTITIDSLDFFVPWFWAPQPRNRRERRIQKAWGDNFRSVVQRIEKRIGEARKAENLAEWVARFWDLVSIPTPASNTGVNRERGSFWPGPTNDDKKSRSASRRFRAPYGQDGQRRS